MTGGYDGKSREYSASARQTRAKREADAGTGDAEEILIKSNFEMLGKCVHSVSGNIKKQDHYSSTNQHDVSQHQ